MAGRTKTKAELEAELAAAYHGLEGCKAALAATIVKNEEVLSMLARVHRIQQDALVSLALAFADVQDERNELRTRLRLANWANKTLKVMVTERREPRLPVALDHEHQYEGGHDHCLICGELAPPVEIVWRDAPGWK